MIKLTRGPCPTKLITQEAYLIAQYLADNTRQVWNRTYIRTSLRAYSSDKCAYCETKLDEESKYFEIDHYLPKNKYKKLVANWNNLLPSCKRCNIEKGAHDPKVDGALINPAATYPAKHLRLLPTARLDGKSPIGNRAIRVIYLNDSRRLVFKRFEVAEAIRHQLEQLRDITLGATWLHNPVFHKQVRRGLAGLLEEAHPSTEYAATAATTLSTDGNYEALKTELVSLGLWDSVLVAADKKMHSMALA